MQEKRKAQKTPLDGLIAEKIAAKGPISVAEYMALCLGHPEHGYYMTAEPFGVAGDFVTAPEVSQLFGEMIGVWIVDLWMRIGKPEKVQLIELGPGRGTLAADVLRVLSNWPEMRVEMSLVETSPRLKKKQAETLGGASAAWYDSLDDVPAGFSFVVANEFFDALPAHQFIRTGEGWKERAVGYDERMDAFFFTGKEAGMDLSAIMPPAFLTAPEGSVFEINPVALDQARRIADRLDHAGGAALIIDYGHAETGLGDTFQALSRHRYADVLSRAGEVDLTTHVDFALLAESVKETARVFGPVTQGDFLTRLGIEARAEAIRKDADKKQQGEIDAALHRLLDPAEMGTLFKVMAFLSRQHAVTPEGF